MIGIRLPTSADEVRSGTQWFTYRNEKARETLGWEPRPHEETLEDAVRWQLQELGTRAEGHRLTDLALRTTGRALGLLPFAPMSEPRRVLYRCGTPTNFLCPCGAVARRLNKLGLEYRTERVRRRRSNRPEIVELTKLPYVPVLVDGDEVVNDSRRILQYLDWRYAGEPSASQRRAPSTMWPDE